MDPAGHPEPRNRGVRLPSIQHILIEDFRIVDDMPAQIRSSQRESFPKASFTAGRTYLKQILPRCLLVSDGNSLVGRMGIEHRVVKLEDGPAAVFGVVDLCEARSHRSHGLATNMLRWVEDLGRENGIEFIVLFADDSRLYERTGFRRPNNRLKWLKIHEHETIGLGYEALPELMVKALGPRRWPDDDVDMLGYVF